MPRGEEDTRGLHERPPSPLGKCAIERSTFTRFYTEENVFFSFFRRDRKILVHLVSSSFSVYGSSYPFLPCYRGHLLLLCSRIKKENSFPCYLQVKYFSHPELVVSFDEFLFVCRAPWSELITIENRCPYMVSLVLFLSCFFETVE